MYLILKEELARIQLLRIAEACKPGGSTSLVIGICSTTNTEGVAQLKAMTEELAIFVADNEKSVRTSVLVEDVTLRKSGQGCAYKVVIEKPESP